MILQKLIISTFIIIFGEFLLSDQNIILKALFIYIYKSFLYSIRKKIKNI